MEIERHQDPGQQGHRFTRQRAKSQVDTDGGPGPQEDLQELQHPHFRARQHVGEDHEKGIQRLPHGKWSREPLPPGHHETGEGVVLVSIHSFLDADILARDKNVDRPQGQRHHAQEQGLVSGRELGDFDCFGITLSFSAIFPTDGGSVPGVPESR